MTASTGKGEPVASFGRRVLRHAAWRGGRVRRTLARGARRATSAARREPSFLVLGASRSGTTTLYDVLAQHPEVAAASRKEVQYFDFHYFRGRGWYRSHFPPLTARARVTGEATPYYLAHPLAPGRVARDYPEMRLIAVVRDPVDRAYSQWGHETALGAETLSFEEAVEREPERLAGEEGRLLADPGYLSWAHFKFSYLARGRYLEQLERWLEHFPREQLLVLRCEDLAERPEDLLSETLAFLGLEPGLSGPIPVLNAREYAPMRAATRERLAAVFAEPNRRLEAFLGRELGWTSPARIPG